MALRVTFSVWVSFLIVFSASAQPAAAQAPPSAACETLKITGQLTPENIRRYGCDGRKPAATTPTVPGTVPGKAMALPGTAAPGKGVAPSGQSATEANPWHVERSENGTWVRHGEYRTDEYAVGGAHRACVDRGRSLPIVAASRVRYQGTVRRQYQCVQYKAVETKPSD